MDPTMVNAFITMALMLLAVASLMLVAAAFPMMNQASRTLIAFEKLADTVQGETKPTLTELREVISGLNQLKSVTAERVTEVSHRVEDVAGTVGNVAGKAKMSSAVWGAGFIAGIRAYLTPRDDGQASTDVKQLSVDGGEGS